MRRNFLLIIVFCWILSLMTSCGQSGGLYLPQQTPVDNAAQAS